MTDVYLFRTALKDLLQLRKVATGLLLALMPPLIALLWRLGAKEDFSEELAYNLLAAALIFGFVLVIMSVVFCTGVISQEIEQKTIMYLLTRPVPRWRIALAKFAAATLVTTVVAWISCLLLALVVYGPSGLGGSPRLFPTQLKDAQVLATRLKDSPDPLSFYLQSKLSEKTQQRLDKYDSAKRPSRRLIRGMIADLNALMESESLYDKDRFDGVTLAPTTQGLLAQNPTSGSGLLRLNRALLEDAFPDAISHHVSPLPHIGRDLLILPVGALAYGTIFLLMATLISRPLIFGLLFAFGWESWIPSLPSDFQRLSVMAYLRVLAPHRIPNSDDTGVNAALSIFNPATISMPFAWGVTSGLIVVALASALVAFSTREYVPREDV